MKLSSFCLFSVVFAAGCGQGPSTPGELRAEPQSVDFGDVAIGSQVDKTISLTVTSGSNVNISGLDITGDAAAAFEVLDVVSVVKAGVPAAVKIRFHAGTVTGNKTAAFKVQPQGATALSVPLQVRVIESATYSNWSAFGACSTTCGTGMEQRTRTCLDSQSNQVNCQLCGGQCTEDRACNGTSCTTPTYTAWSAWSTCTGGMQSRQRSCELNGTSVPCADCGGQCNQNQACGTCSAYGVNVVNCGSKADCDATLETKHTSCVAAGCTWSGPMMCSIGGSSSSATCNGATATCQ